MGADAADNIARAKYLANEGYDGIIHIKSSFCTPEISSMGIRVNSESLNKQLEYSGHQDWKKYEYHQKVLNNELPLTIGGGIGQSRLCMLLLQKHHIGEVQVSVWPAGEKDIYENIL